MGRGNNNFLYGDQSINLSSRSKENYASRLFFTGQANYTGQLQSLVDQFTDDNNALPINYSLTLSKLDGFCFDKKIADNYIKYGYEILYPLLSNVSGNDRMIFKERVPEWMNMEINESLEETSYMYDLQPRELTIPTREDYQELGELYIKAHLLNNQEYLTDLNEPEFKYIQCCSESARGAIIQVYAQENPGLITLDKLTAIERIFANHKDCHWKQHSPVNLTAVPNKDLWYFSGEEPLAAVNTFSVLDQAEKF
jgi:hypothetical protein